MASFSHFTKNCLCGDGSEELTKVLIAGVLDSHVFVLALLYFLSPSK
jgi:hypothetical protein